MIFNPCGEFRWSMEGTVIQIHSPHLIIPGKNCSLGSWVRSGRPAFSRTAALVPAFVVEDLPLDRTHRWWYTLSWSLLMFGNGKSYMALGTSGFLYHKIKAFAGGSYIERKGLSSVSIRTLLNYRTSNDSLYMYDLRSIFYYEHIPHYISFYY